MKKVFLILMVLMTIFLTSCQLHNTILSSNQLKAKINALTDAKYYESTYSFHFATDDMDTTINPLFNIATEVTDKGTITDITYDNAIIKSNGYSPYELISDSTNGMLYFSDGVNWSKFDQTGLAPNGNTLNVTSMITNINQIINNCLLNFSDFHYVGDEKVNGKSMTHYKISIDVYQALESIYSKINLNSQMVNFRTLISNYHLTSMADLFKALPIDIYIDNNQITEVNINLINLIDSLLTQQDIKAMLPSDLNQTDFENYFKTLELDIAFSNINAKKSIEISDQAKNGTLYSGSNLNHFINTIYNSFNGKYNLSVNSSIDFNDVYTQAIMDPNAPVIYFLAPDKNSLVKYNLNTKASVSITFPDKPETMVYSKGKIYVTLLKGDHSSYWSMESQGGAYAVIDTTDFSDKVYNVSIDPYGIAVDNNGYVFISSGSGQWADLYIYNSLGQYECKQEEIFENSKIDYNAITNSFYLLDTGLSPMTITEITYNSANNSVSKKKMPFGEIFPLSQNDFISPDGKYIFNGSGNIFLSNEAKSDMKYKTSIKQAFTDMAFNIAGNEFYLLNGNQVYLYNYLTFQEIYHFEINEIGKQIIYNDNQLYILGNNGQTFVDIIYLNN